MRVGAVLQRSTRSVDLAARLGGDEFCVLAPQQECQAAMTLATRLATAVRENAASPGEPPVSLSIGVAACPSHGNDAESLNEAADSAMYRAKAMGETVALGEPLSAEVAEGAES